MIELGRYNQTTRDNRNCPFCGSNHLEDEVHFLFNCSKYSLIRNNFYYKFKILIPNITQLPVNVLINDLMNTSNNVSVKSKLQHAPPPRAYPGHLTPLPSRGGGNLIIRVFQGVGNLIPML